MQPRLLSANGGESLRAAALAGLASLPSGIRMARRGCPGRGSADLRVLVDYEPPSGGIYAVYPTNRLAARSARSSW